MALAKKKAPKKKRAVLKRVAKKKAASKKRPTRTPEKKPSVKKVTRKKTSKARKVNTKSKKKTTTRKKGVKKITKKSVKNKVKLLKVTTTDRDISSQVHIVDRSGTTDASAKGKFLKASEIKLVRPTIGQFFSNHRVLKNVASYAGVAIVVIGGTLSLLNMQAIVEPISVTNSTQTVNQAANVIGDEAEDSTLHKTPEPKIVLDSRSNLNDIEKVAVVVPYAEKVVVLAKSLEYNQVLTLGQAHFVDESTWKFEWDTRKFEDGEYRLKIVVNNRHGSYDYADDATYIVENTYESLPEEDFADSFEKLLADEAPNEVSTVHESPSDDGTATTTNTAQEGAADPVSPTADEDSEVRLVVANEDSVSGRAKLEILTEGSSRVKLYAKNSNTLNTHFLGYATKKSEGKWQLTWDTRNVINGLYKVHAIAIINDSSVSSDSEEVYVENTIETIIDETDSSSTTDEIYEEHSDEPDDEELHPEIDLSISKENPVSNFAKITVRTTQAKWVEVYAVAKNSLVLKFLGLAKRDSDGLWAYLWDTTQAPNGEYMVYARIKTEFGFTEGERRHVVVKNEILEKYSEEQEKHIDVLTSAKDELIEITENLNYGEDESDSGPLTSNPATVYIDPADSFVETIDVEEDEQEEIKEILNSYRAELNGLMNDLARAQRRNDEVLLKRTSAKMLELKNEIVSRLESSLEKDAVVKQIHAYISQIAFELEEVTIENEKILVERIGEKLSEDSDKDSISDYDEIHIYKTNPYVADSDGDGFDDSTEIESGYNPNDSRSEALIVYESPKEVGIVREELFAIESITTVDVENGAQSENPTALITGKGLPNSFVTIYIFSTPVIVTVRTDSDGSWRYVFDKELEDGEHEVYVGVTDNAGKIVGKSEPLKFIKTAEAYSVSESSAPQVTEEVTGGSLVEGRALLLIGSLAVVSLGLVLILLGLHVSGRKEDTQIITQI